MRGISVGLLGKFPSIIVGDILVPVREEQGNSFQFSYQVLVSSGQTISPTFMFNSGAPTARVDFGDGSDLVPVFHNVELFHTYENSGIYTVKLISELQELYLQRVDIANDNVILPSSWTFLLTLYSLIRLTDYWVIGYGEVGVLRIGR